MRARVDKLSHLQIKDALRNELEASTSQYDPDRLSDPVTSAWDRLQSELACCGVSTADAPGQPPWHIWKANSRLNSGDADSRVPQSCCLAAGEGGARADCSSSSTADPKLLYQADCFAATYDFVGQHVTTLCALCAVFAVALILSASLSICLYYLVVA